MMLINGLLNKRNCMKLKSALELLRLCKNTFKINPGKFDRGTHSMVLEADKLVLTINTGTDFKSFIINDDDYEKDPNQIVSEIKKYIELKRVSYNIPSLHTGLKILYNLINEKVS